MWALHNPVKVEHSIVSVLSDHNPVASGGNEIMPGVLLGVNESLINQAILITLIFCLQIYKQMQRSTEIFGFIFLYLLQFFVIFFPLVSFEGIKL